MIEESVRLALSAPLMLDMARRDLPVAFVHEVTIEEAKRIASDDEPYHWPQILRARRVAS
jgi:hypothetical protein